MNFKLLFFITLIGFAFIKAAVEAKIEEGFRPMNPTNRQPPPDYVVNSRNPEIGPIPKTLFKEEEKR